MGTRTFSSGKTLGNPIACHPHLPKESFLLKSLHLGVNLALSTLSMIFKAIFNIEFGFNYIFYYIYSQILFIMNKLIGRKKELATLKSLLYSDKSEFIAVYGRRRVGKTFLIRSAFNQQFTFQVTALANATLSQQLTNFHVALQKDYPAIEHKPTTNWFSAFQQLIAYIESVKETRKVIFFDELPWFDTQASGFIPVSYTHLTLPTN